MSTIHDAATPGILSTMDTFIQAVPWGEWPAVLVFHRQHGGRSYVRLRTWNRHRARGLWYPTKRFFVMPVEHAGALAGAIQAAARGVPVDEKPEWYEARERTDQERHEQQIELEAPRAVSARSRRRMMKAR